MKSCAFFVLFFLASFALQAQNEPDTKFGKITPSDLERKVYTIDSNANAVVLYEVGTSKFEGNSKDWFSVVFKCRRRIHILNKNAYSLADIEIPLYDDGSYEAKLTSLKASTYNLENGQVVETKLDKANVFKERLDKNYSLKKFTFPNIKEGSIIEYEYEINSDFIQQLMPWSFQGTTPRLWSEYTVSIPQFFNYVFLSQGYNGFYKNDRKNYRSTYVIREQRTAGPSEVNSVSCGVTDYHWVMKDIAALKEESFTSTLQNHIAKIEFQLSAFADPLQARNIMGTWPELMKSLLAHEYFGGNLKTPNFWLSDMVKPLTSTATTDLEKAQKIFAYVRDNYTCTDHSSVYMDHQLKDMGKLKSGNVSEINLLLTAMLRYANINVSPVLLSTTGHGYAYELYPLLSRFNYVVARATINGKDYLLDASRPHLGFGKLTPECYNGYARVVNEEAIALPLVSDSLKERKVTNIIIANDEKGNWQGSFSQYAGYNESYDMRNRINDKGREAFFNEFKNTYGMDVTLKNTGIDSLNMYDLPLRAHYDMDFKLEKDDILYVNPMFGENKKENPFKSSERSYPVEMPYTSDETYILSMEVPKGYEVDELPKQIKIKMNDAGDAYFEYLITNSNDIISLRTRIYWKRAYFSPDEYESMREFYKMVVSKQNEQIVFKKKK